MTDSPKPSRGEQTWGRYALLGALLLLALSGLAFWVRERARKGERAAAVAPIAPPPGIRPAEPGRTLTLAIVGDFGRCGESEVECAREEAVARLVDSWSPDYVITTGDNNYPRGERSTAAVNLAPYRAYIESGRFVPVLGNHDWGCDECPRPHIEQFNPPGNGRYYSLHLNGLGVWVLDSDAKEPDGNGADSAQARWLREGLTASESRLDLVFLHHPPYSSGHHGSSERLRWPFAAWGAGAVFSGHEHSYERLDVGGTPYFVNGSGGARLRGFRRPLPGSRCRYAADHGAQRLVWDGETATIEFFDISGNRVDHVSLSGGGRAGVDS